MSRMDIEDMRGACQALLNGMDGTSLTQQTTQGSNVFHHAVSRGNVECLKVLKEHVDHNFSRNYITREFLNVKTAKGKTVLDMAYYNSDSPIIVSSLGGDAVYTNGDEEARK